MNNQSKNYFKGIAMMAGTIIGVGVFAVPYVMAKSGVLIGLAYFVILGIILIYNHLLYGEAILRTGTKHRLAGLAEMYLGKKWEYVTLLVTMLSFYGGLIAYIIIGGEFLRVLLIGTFGGSLLLYQVIFFVVMALVVLIGLKIIFFAEFLMTMFLLITAGILIFGGLPYVDFNNFLTVDFNNFFLPYGVILFSLAGAAAIPEVIDAMGSAKKKIKGVVILGTIIPIIVTVLFGLVVVGVNGIDTTQDAIEGFGLVVGHWIVVLGAFFGLFAVATSFLAMGIYLKDQFELDMGLNNLFSWFLAVFIPFLVFLFGSRDFIKVVGFTGAVFAGFEGVLIVVIYMLAKKRGKRKPEYIVKIHWFFALLMIAVFLTGVIYEIWGVLI